MATMRPLENGAFSVSWYDTSGVRHRRRFQNKALAQKQYDLVCGARLFENAGIAHVHSTASQNFKRMLFSELAGRYVNEHLIPLTRSACNEAYIRILTHKWGRHRLCLITRQAFRDWLFYALKNPIWTASCKDGETRQLSVRTCGHLSTYMIRIFNWGVEQNIVPGNHLAKVKDETLKKEFRRGKRKRREVLTVEEFERVIESWPSYVRGAAVVAFYSGLRRSELCSCQWRQVDRKAMCIHYEASETKEADAKTVFYDQEADAVFERLEIDYITSGHTDGFVFRGERGKPLTPHSFTAGVRYWFKEHAKRTGEARYATMSPHTFRRSYKTRKSVEGCDLKAVAANMGHHSLATADIYDQVTVERQRGVAGRNQSTAIAPILGDMLSKARASGMDLADVQSQIRRAWTGALGNFGQSGQSDDV